ncbi:PD40 domain-containing protein [Treponema parvum]|uniref:PD40 domain-containing protein n=1 Tax=Treponema parvum TaxID=138851 RepID=UPI001AEC15B2|nr:PD40 domain-containing protein [Treponema parvum]QTQ16550.1 PD40 domain-containing protein [Treponema parvum]
MKFKVGVLPLAAAVIFSVVYIFAAVYPLSKELQFIPEWTVSAVQNPAASETNKKDEGLIPFKIGQTVGYFTEDGKIAMSQSFPVKAAVSEYYYAPYGLGDTSIQFYSPDGIPRGVIGASGFPFIDEDRLYLFLPGGASFSQYGADGQRLWTYEGFVPVTAFSSSKCGCIAGFADGKIIAFYPDGTLMQEFVPGGSKYPVILGADISYDGKLFACLSGLEKQRIVLVRTEKKHAVITFFKYMEKDRNVQSLVRFSKDGKWLYYASSEGLGIVNCEDLKDSEIKMSGWISAIKETDIPGTFFVLTKDKRLWTVYAVENFKSLTGKFSFEADFSFIQTRKNDLFIGKDLKISKIRLSKE